MNVCSDAAAELLEVLLHPLRCCRSAAPLDLDLQVHLVQLGRESNWLVVGMVSVAGSAFVVAIVSADGWRVGVEIEVGVEADAGNGGADGAVMLVGHAGCR